MKETNETHDALDVITRLDERINLEHAETNGRRTTTIHAAYSSGHLFAIEQFVRAIETDSRDGPVSSDSHHAVDARIKMTHWSVLGANQQATPAGRWIPLFLSDETTLEGLRYGTALSSYTSHPHKKCLDRTGSRLIAG